MLYVLIIFSQFIFRNCFYLLYLFCLFGSRKFSYTHGFDSIIIRKLFLKVFYKFLYLNFKFGHKKIFFKKSLKFLFFSILYFEGLHKFSDFY